MNGSLYTVLFILHIVALASAFGPVIIYASLLRRGLEAKGGSGHAVFAAASSINSRVVLPGLIGTTLIGLGLVVVSDAFSFEHAWVSASMTLALILAAIGYFLISPSLSALAEMVKDEGDAAVAPGKSTAAKTLRISTGLYQVGFVVIVWLMYAKPGMG